MWNLTLQKMKLKEDISWERLLTKETSLVVKGNLILHFEVQRYIHNKDECYLSDGFSDGFKILTKTQITQKVCVLC